jgi:hypothetical protein
MRQTQKVIDALKADTAASARITEQVTQVLLDDAADRYLSGPARPRLITVTTTITVEYPSVGEKQ